MRYFLEEKINGKYICLDIIFEDYNNMTLGFYWDDDETLYYLQKELVYDPISEYYIETWIPYSTKFYPKVK